MLAQTLHRIGAVSAENARELRIGGKARQKIVTDRGDRVITAKTLVQSRRLLCERWQANGRGPCQ
jgi:hypothetical protein